MASRGVNSGAAYAGGATRDAGRGESGRADPGRAETQAVHGQRYSRAPEPPRGAGRPGENPAENKDSLAELARLIGDQDPFAEFSDLERKGANASSAEDDDYDDYDTDEDLDADRADDDHGRDAEDEEDEEDDEGDRWSAAVAPARQPAPLPASRGDAYGRAGGYGDPASLSGRSAAPASSAYGRAADGRGAAPSGAGRYDDEDDDVYAAPSRPAQLPAPRAGAAYSAAAAPLRAAAAPASPAVRSGYGSLARPPSLPSPAQANGYASRPAAASYDDGDDDDYEDDDRARGYDAEDDDDYAPPAVAPRADARAPAPRAADPRAADARAYDSRSVASRAPQSGASPRAALPIPAAAARGEARRAPDGQAYAAHAAHAYATPGQASRGQGAKGQAVALQAPARGAERHVPPAPAYDTDDYDDDYDDEAYDDGHGAKPQDPRAYARGADAARGRASHDRAGEAAYAYSTDRRDDNSYDDYDDAYDPQFADDGYMPPHGEDIYESEPRRRKGRMALLMVASVLGLAVAGAATFFAYRMAVGETTFGSATPEVIRADSAPVKTVTPPTADSQGKLITERLGAGGSPNERLVTREESPVEVTAATRAGAGATGQGEPKRVKTYAVRPDGTMAAPAGGTAAPAGSSLTAFAPVQSPGSAAPGAAPAQTGAVAPPVAASGSYVVQVASQRSEADAQGSWKALQAKYPSLLGSYTAQVRKADLGERGVFYRAQVGPFASRDQANDLCQALRGQGGDCIVNKN
ncbi:SPOR domain-containing protein [Xanthobacter sp. KR7-225]|uniref:SPOR domain-containing protein n=1 Tax=Xanthobacter sp. KR7-225 TaxID=3156613 RepID=UPI0032B4D354